MARAESKRKVDPGERVTTARDVLALVKLGATKGRGDADTHVLLSPHGLGVAGNGFTVRYLYPDAGGRTRVIPTGTILAPGQWVREVLALAKKEGDTVVFDRVDNGRDDAPRAQARVKGKKFTIEGLPIKKLYRAPVPSPGSTAHALEVADFTARGPVAAACAAASKDESRPGVNAVHLDTHATATEGHVLARRPLARPLAAPMLLPLAMARAVCTLVARTMPERLVVRRDGAHAWFSGRTANGARWTLAGAIPDASAAPRYASVRADVIKPTLASFTVDAAELHGLVKSVGAGYELAFFRDGGMVVWEGAGDGVGCSLDTYPTEEPATTLLAGALGKVLGLLPAKGRIAVEVTADMTGTGAVLVNGEIVMPKAGGDELPEGVRQGVREAFGLNGRALSAPRVENPPAPYQATAFGLPALHLGPPTPDDIKSARAHGGARFTGWPELELRERPRPMSEPANDDAPEPPASETRPAGAHSGSRSKRATA